MRLLIDSQSLVAAKGVKSFVDSQKQDLGVRLARVAFLETWFNARQHEPTGISPFQPFQLFQQVSRSKPCGSSKFKGSTFNDHTSSPMLSVTSRAASAAYNGGFLFCSG
jgi:hypothetical protein